MIWHAGASGGVVQTGSHSPGGAIGILPNTPIVVPEVKVPFSLSQVDVFLAVARTGSYISASLARSISQPAVSKSLSGLEQVFLTCFTHRLHVAGHDITPCAAHCHSWLGWPQVLASVLFSSSICGAGKKDA